MKPLWTVRAYGDFIVLPNWDIRPRAPLPAIPLSHYPDTEPDPEQYPDTVLVLSE